MQSLTAEDLHLISSLSSRTYSGNRLLSNATDEEVRQLKKIKTKLKELAHYFSDKYKNDYGPFETSVVTGNDIAIGGTRMGRIWSGIFKGAKNKQYAAQISFVVNANEQCLDVGFYFGRAAGRKMAKDEKRKSEQQLQNLAITLSNTITGNASFRGRYMQLFDAGYTAYIGDKTVSGEQWVEMIKAKASNSHIITKIYPNDFDVVENVKIDSYVALIIFLMTGITNSTNYIASIKPFTPEQFVKQAERQAEIGMKGELHIMEMEQRRLKDLGLNKEGYPDHVALKSVNYGYDILSHNEKGEDLFIEVKTTTRKKGDYNSNVFFLSANEYRMYEQNKDQFKLYRVYDIENEPIFEVIDIEKTEKRPEGFICKY